jgi:hypothetical protein
VTDSDPRQQTKSANQNDQEAYSMCDGRQFFPSRGATLDCLKTKSAESKKNQENAKNVNQFVCAVRNHEANPMAISSGHPPI